MAEETGRRWRIGKQLACRLFGRVVASSWTNACLVRRLLVQAKQSGTKK